jgi:hypothetical protein
MSNKQAIAAVPPKPCEGRPALLFLQRQLTMDPMAVKMTARAKGRLGVHAGKTADV